VSWPLVKMSDTFLGLYDGPHGTPRPSDEGRVFLGIGNITDDGHLDLSSARRIADDQFAQWTKRVTPQPKDIVFTYEATLNRYAIIPNGFDGCLGRRVALIRPNPDVADYRFLFYSFFSREWRETIERNRLSGATVDRVPLSLFPNFPIRLPSLPIQHRIADILSAYDDLIENNTRRIAILEDMARRLFEEWFACAESENELEINGWRTASLKEVAEISYGFPFKSNQFSAQANGTPVVRIRDVPDGRSNTWTQEPFDPKYTVKNGDILIGMDGIFHMSQWSGGDAALNQRVARLRPREGFSRGFIFLSAYPQIKFFEATITGTTVAHLGAKHLDTIRIRVAPPDVQRKADEFLSEIDAQVLCLRVTNTNLRATRDLLLPKLISGGIEVRAAEEELEAAAA